MSSLRNENVMLGKEVVEFLQSLPPVLSSTKFSEEKTVNFSTLNRIADAFFQEAIAKPTWAAKTRFFSIISPKEPHDITEEELKEINSALESIKKIRLPLSKADSSIANQKFSELMETSTTTAPIVKKAYTVYLSFKKLIEEMHKKNNKIDQEVRDQLSKSVEILKSKIISLNKLSKSADKRNDLIKEINSEIEAIRSVLSKIEERAEMKARPTTKKAFYDSVAALEPVANVERKHAPIPAQNNEVSVSSVASTDNDTTRPQEQKRSTTPVQNSTPVNSVTIPEEKTGNAKYIRKIIAKFEDSQNKVIRDAGKDLLEELNKSNQDLDFSVLEKQLHSCQLNILKSLKLMMSKGISLQSNLEKLIDEGCFNNLDKAKLFFRLACEEILKNDNTVTSSLRDFYMLESRLNDISTLANLPKIEFICELPPSNDVKSWLDDINNKMKEQIFASYHAFFAKLKNDDRAIDDRAIQAKIVDDRAIQAKIVEFNSLLKKAHDSMPGSEQSVLDRVPPLNDIDDLTDWLDEKINKLNKLNTLKKDLQLSEMMDEIKEYLNQCAIELPDDKKDIDAIIAFTQIDNTDELERAFFDNALLDRFYETEKAKKDPELTSGKKSSEIHAAAHALYKLRQYQLLHHYAQEPVYTYDRSKKKASFEQIICELSFNPNIRKFDNEKLETIKIEHVRASTQPQQESRAKPVLASQPQSESKRNVSISVPAPSQTGWFMSLIYRFINWCKSNNKKSSAPSSPSSQESRNEPSFNQSLSSLFQDIPPSRERTISRATTEVGSPSSQRSSNLEPSSPRSSIGSYPIGGASLPKGTPATSGTFNKNKRQQSKKVPHVHRKTFSNH